MEADVGALFALGGVFKELRETTGLVVRNMKLTLHAFDNGLDCFVGTVSIGSAEFHTSERPICIET